MSEENWFPELNEIFNNLDDIKNALQRIGQKLDQKKSTENTGKCILQRKQRKKSIHYKNPESND